MTTPAATLDTTTAPAVKPVKLSAKEKKAAAAAAIAKIRNDEIATARGVYVRCTLGARSGGGSDLVGRALRALKLIDGADFTDCDSLIEAFANVKSDALLAWATPYLAGLVDNKQNQRRRDAFVNFCAVDGFGGLCNALRTFKKYSAWAWGETLRNPKTGTSVKVNIDVLGELNNMFALKVTLSRRAKWGVVNPSA